MKKRFISIILSLTMVVSLMVSGMTVTAETNGDFEYEVLDDGTVEIVEYSGNAEDLEIPSEIDGKTVTNIGERAFSGCDSLNTVSIPKGVKKLGDYSFEWCSSLTSVIIPDSVTNIGIATFSYCKSLTNVLVPTSVTNIEQHAFEGCTLLSNITIPNNVISIGYDAFYNTALYNNESNWQDGALYIDNNLISGIHRDFDFKIITEVKDNYSIKENTKVIANRAFEYCGKLKSVIMPDSLTNVGSYAFSGCKSLETVKISKNVSDIGCSAFYGCASLKEISVPKENNFYSSLDGVLFNKDFTTLISYPAKKNTIEYSIPNSVTNIDAQAFYSCGLLENVTIPEGVSDIGDEAFEYCTSLKSIIIPNSVTNIGDSAFSNCISLNTATIGNNVTSINDYTFEYCTSLSNISLPDSINCIGHDAFYETEYYNNTANWDNELLYLGNYLLAAKENIYECVIKTGTSVIADNTFYGCNHLTYVTIPDSVTKIGDSVFSDCTALEEVKLPDSITTIGEGAFYGCICLDRIEIPNSVNEIRSCAFTECLSLTRIVIPGSVKIIDDHAIGYYYENHEIYDFVQLPNLHIYCYEESVGEQYAIDNGFDYTLIDENTPIFPITSKYGDVNTDSKINLLDLITMRKYLAGWNVEIDREAADCYTDGNVNLLDLILMRKYLAKWDVTFGPKSNIKL